MVWDFVFSGVFSYGLRCDSEEFCHPTSSDAFLHLFSSYIVLFFIVYESITLFDDSDLPYKQKKEEEARTGASSCISAFLMFFEDMSLFYCSSSPTSPSSTCGADGSTFPRISKA